MWPVCMWPGESACSFLRRRGGASSSISSSYETCRWDFAPKPPCVDWEGPGIFVCSSARARQQERNQKIKFFCLHPFLKETKKDFPKRHRMGPHTMRSHRVLVAAGGVAALALMCLVIYSGSGRGMRVALVGKVFLFAQACFWSASCASTGDRCSRCPLSLKARTCL
jgi:hypothetical protein